MAPGLLRCDRDIVEIIVGFVGAQAYLSVASVSTQWRTAWGQQPATTSRRWAVQSRSCLDWARVCGLDIWDSPCLFAAAEGRLDVLEHAVGLGYSREGMPICEWAAARGHMEVVKWCRANGYPWGMSSIRAAEGGHLEVLTWCVANGCPINVGIGPLQYRPEILSPRGHYRGKQSYQRERLFDVFSAAAKGGHLETVIWCRDQGYPWSSETSYMAAEGGNLDVLMWLRANGCPWHSETMAGVAEIGDLQILEWCRSNGCPWDNFAVIAAAAGGNLEVVKWCFANDPHGHNHVIIALAVAAGRGHLEVVQWMRTNGCSWTDEVCYMAACGGHVEVLKWCLANGCPWGYPMTHRKPEFIGRVSMMMWAASDGCPWMSAKRDFNALCKHAARGGNMEVLQWCAGYRPLSISAVSREAASEGHVHILEWLRATGSMSEGGVDLSLCKMAAHSGSLETVKWCRANNFPWDPRTTEAAMLSGNLELLQWCRANGCPWDKNTFKMATFQNDIEAMAWCHSNGCPLDVRQTQHRVGNGYDEVDEWCRDNLHREPGEQEKSF